jgi:hypothetical protein
VCSNEKQINIWFRTYCRSLQRQVDSASKWTHYLLYYIDCEVLVGDEQLILNVFENNIRTGSGLQVLLRFSADDFKLQTTYSTVYTTFVTQLHHYITIFHRPIYWTISVIRWASCFCDLGTPLMSVGKLYWLGVCEFLFQINSCIIFTIHFALYCPGSAENGMLEIQSKLCQIKIIKLTLDDKIVSINLRQSKYSGTLPVFMDFRFLF